MDKKLKPVRYLDAEDGTIYGRYNKTKMVNPLRSKFVVYYSDGTIQEGNNLYDTGWATVRDGIKLLQYRLSTGHVINIPKFIGYFPTIEVSESTDGFKLFHAIHVRCLGDNEILKYKIVLKQDHISKYRIGDVIVSKEGRNFDSPHWKMAG